MNIPIISLQVEGMKHVVKMALTKEAAALDAAVQKAVDDYCTEGNINAIVRREAIAQVDAALKEEVRNFFTWSNGGRLAIREAVTEHLNERFPQRD